MITTRMSIRGRMRIIRRSSRIVIRRRRANRIIIRITTGRRKLIIIRIRRIIRQRRIMITR